MQALDHHMIAALDLQLLIRAQHMVLPGALHRDPSSAAVDAQHAGALGL
jgi:hypothetical protein